MKPLIIGLSGPAGSGKDEAAAIFLAELENACLHADQMALADPIKEICDTLFMMSPDDMNTFEGKEKPCEMYPDRTNREMLQKVGTECFRDVISETIWIDILLKRAEYFGYDVVVISDIRFENEAKLVKENGFLIHIAPEFDGFTGITREGDAAHASEAGYDQIPDQVIINDGTLEEFQEKVKFVSTAIVTPLMKIVLEEARGFAINTFRKSIVDTIQAVGESLEKGLEETKKVS